MDIGLNCDFVIFASVLLTGLSVTHVCMRRSRLRCGMKPYAWALQVCLLAGGFLFVHHAGENERASLRKQISGIAPTFAQEIQLLDHSRIALETPPDDPGYLAIIEAQKRYLRVNPSVADIYTFRLLPNGKVALICDSETDYDHSGTIDSDREKRTRIGEEYGEPDEQLLAAFQGQSRFNDHPYRDRWGTWVSAYEPLRDPAGNVEAVLGVDYPASDWVKMIRDQRLRAIGLLGVVSLVFVVSHVFIVILQTDLKRRKLIETALRNSEARFRGLADTAPVLIWMSDATGACSYLNRAWEALTGRAQRDLLGSGWLEQVHQEDRERFAEHLSTCTIEGSTFTFECRLRRHDGEFRWVLCTGAQCLDSEGRVAGYIGSCLDITDRKLLIEQMQQTQQQLEQAFQERSTQLVAAERQMMQNEKLASVGQLAAGIAHEINTPIQYVGDNLRAISDSVSELLALIGEQREFIEAVKAGKATPEDIERIEKAAEEHDLEYFSEDTPQAIQQGLDGVQRVAHIVRAMKDFSHVQREEMTASDLNHSIESTLVVARNEYKYYADVETILGELPPVDCYVSEINQVLLNMLVNAAHAIADTQQRGKITISTCVLDDEHVQISIADTGTGMTPEVQKRVYDPFFTTKEVGKGTGQGLYLAHQIIVQKHGGLITLESEVGKGTTFHLRLPIHGKPADAPAEKCG